MTTFVVESLDDQPNGIFHCYSDESVYQTYKIPRHLIDNASLEYLDNHGVYLLFGENIGANYVGDVYVMSTILRRGEKDTISQILEGQRNINWKDVVVFTTENNTWGATELMYLEYAFYKIAKESKRYNVVNSSSPVSVPIQKRTKDAMDKFIIWAENILGMFGYKFSEPNNVSLTSDPEPNEPKPIDSGVISVGPTDIANTPFSEGEAAPDASKHILLYMTCKDAHATGWYDGNTFTICKGSVISSIKAPSCKDDIEKNRRKYSNLIDSNNMLKEDITFRTPSGAAGFVAYHGVSGNMYWRDKRGVTLRELLTKKKLTKPTTQITQSGQSRNNTPSEFEPVIVFMSTRGASAFGMYDGRQFLLCKDSVLCSEKSVSCSRSIIELREKYADKIDQSNILTEDIIFKKPSQAAAFVALKSENGYECWHDAYGNSLNKIMNRSPKRKS